MPKIRTIKPKFFTDSKIGKLKPLARLFFIGLWCHADRQGRLEDDPEELEIQIMPYDARGGSVGAVDLLEELSMAGFIQRYTMNAKGYIQILNFEKHQRVHHTEAESQIPPPNGEVTVKPPLDHREHREGKEGKGKERKGKEVEGKGGAGGADAPAAPGRAGLTPRQVASLWNDKAVSSLPRVLELGKKRLAKLKVRISEHPDLEWWDRLIKAVNESSFLRGARGEWKASLDWLIANDSNASKVLEGNYADKPDTTGLCVVCRKNPVRGPKSQLCVDCAHCAICGNNIGMFSVKKREDGTAVVTCKGQCADPAGHRKITCQTCNATGKKIIGEKDDGEVVKTLCPDCKGTGKVHPGPVSVGDVAKTRTPKEGNDA